MMMARLPSLLLLLAHLALVFALPTDLLDNVPVVNDLLSGSSSSSSNYWLANINRQGVVPFGNSTEYKVFRNVRDYGAKGMFPLLRW